MYAKLNSFILISILVVVVLIGLIQLHDEEILSRRLTEPYLPNKRHFEFPGKRVINTTTPDLYKDFMDLLSQRLSSYEKGKVMDNSNISSVIDQVKEEMGWDKSTNNFKDLTVINKMIHKLNNFEWKLTKDPTMSEVAKKRLDEYVSNEYAILSTEVVNSMFDIIVLTGNTSMDVNYLDDWKDVIENVHVIIIQQGDPSRLVEIPSWVDYELYTKLDVIKTVGVDASWIFDMDGNSLSAANFGFIVSDRDFMFYLDKDCIPINRHHTHVHIGSDGSKNVLFDLFRLHADNLMRPTAPYYYNNQDPYTQTDSYNSTTDYVRGYPYDLREGVQTMLSYGSVHHFNGADALTRFMKPNAIQGHTKHVRTKAEAIKQQTHSNNHNDMVVTVPHSSLFSLSMKNVAINRKMFGSVFCLFGAAGSKVDYAIGANYEIITGWVLKKLADHTGAGIKHAINPMFLTYTGDKSVSESNPHGQLFDEMKGDLLWLAHHEEIVNWFSSVELSGKSRDDVGAASVELARRIKDELGAIHPVYRYIGDIMLIFLDLFNKKNGFSASIFPVSSRSSSAPPKDSPHKCAAFTIVHNETDMKDVWIRYYGKHMPGALWILNHQSGADAAANKITFNPAVIGGPNTAKVVDLYGDGAGFPMGFLIATADKQQRRLLRYGYSCVVLSDVDEMLVPDPDKYPGGLSEFLTAFSNDSTKTITRAVGYILAHVSDKEDTKIVSKLEPPIDWTKSILEQRHYHARQPKYDKPLVSKIAVHWKPGFHTTFLPAYVGQDTDLMLFHLRELDADFCLGREYQKYLLMRRAHQSEIDKALNGHINNFPAMVKSGETCQFAIASVRADGNAFERTGKAVLEVLPDKYRNVLV